MPSMTPAQVREYFARLKLANEFEIEELRKAPIELKLKQLWALMTATYLFKNEGKREARARDEVRKRWSRLYKAQRD